MRVHRSEGAREWPGAGQALAARLGAAATVAGLAASDPQRLANEVDLLSNELPAYADRWGRAAHAGLLFSPVVDGEVVPNVPWRLLADGRAASIEVLTGHTRDEFRLFLALAGRLGKITEQDAATPCGFSPPEPMASRHITAATRTPAPRPCMSWCIPTRCSGCPRCT